MVRTGGDGVDKFDGISGELRVGVVRLVVEGCGGVMSGTGG